ncbi:hypothetical protein CCR75_005537 [Bremia lactucae]|uniref:Uncharacterized protein n=1 Tax=Bremia lactucae TaxID=4779 RepID=A0A976FQM0_BRELC|nr:hypothetical protein CCR75_005537 [Bremia lactucae]
MLIGSVQSKRHGPTFKLHPHCIGLFQDYPTNIYITPAYFGAVTSSHSYPSTRAIKPDLDSFCTDRILNTTWHVRQTRCGSFTWLPFVLVRPEKSFGNRCISTVNAEQSEQHTRPQWRQW